MLELQGWGRWRPQGDNLSTSNDCIPRWNSRGGDTGDPRATTCPQAMIANTPCWNSRGGDAGDPRATTCPQAMIAYRAGTPGVETLETPGRQLVHKQWLQTQHAGTPGVGTLETPGWQLVHKQWLQTYRAGTPGGDNLSTSNDCKHTALELSLWRLAGIYQAATLPTIAVSHHGRLTKLALKRRQPQHLPTDDLKKNARSECDTIAWAKNPLIDCTHRWNTGNTRRKLWIHQWKKNQQDILGQPLEPKWKYKLALIWRDSSPILPMHKTALRLSINKKTERIRNYNDASKKKHQQNITKSRNPASPPTHRPLVETSRWSPDPLKEHGTRWPRDRLGRWNFLRDSDDRCRGTLICALIWSRAWAENTSNSANSAPTFRDVSWLPTPLASSLCATSPCYICDPNVTISR